MGKRELVGVAGTFHHITLITEEDVFAFSALINIESDKHCIGMFNW